MEKHKNNAVRFSLREYRLWWRWQYIGSVVSTMPKEIRERLLFDGDQPTTRLDIGSAYPTMLPWLFLDDIEYLHSKEKIDEMERELRITEKAKLSHALSDGDFYQILRPGKSRTQTKQAFHHVLTSPSLYPEAKAVFRKFKAQFPKCAGMILRRRRAKGTAQGSNENNDQISSELHGRQTEIIKATIIRCRRAGIPCIPVSDEMIVPFSEQDRVTVWMSDEIRERTGVNAKIGSRRLP